MWYVCDVMYAVLYVCVYCFVVCGCAVCCCVFGLISYSWVYPFIKWQPTLCAFSQVSVITIIGKVYSKPSISSFNLSKLAAMPLILALRIEKSFLYFSKDLRK